MGDLPEMVLLIDDNDSFGRATLRVLSSVGIKAKIFGNPSELRNAPSLPQGSCLLCDILMGQINGLDAVESLFERDERCAIVFMSATQDLENLSRAERISRQPCLRKPFELDELLDALRLAMRLHA